MLILVHTTIRHFRKAQEKIEQGLGIQGDFGLVGIILIRPLNILLFAGVGIEVGRSREEVRVEGEESIGII